MNNLLDLDPTLGRRLRLAFPVGLADAVDAAIDSIEPRLTSSMGEFPVFVSGESLTIPYRLYDKDSVLAHHPHRDPGNEPSRIASDAEVVRACLLTRHNDGYVRMASLAWLVDRHAVTRPWVVPFVVRLLSEYVIEIVDLINDRIAELADPASAETFAFREFALANPDFMRLTWSRSASYWSAYFRSRYPKMADCPSIVLLDRLR